jgi:hypothetical protein
MTAAQVAAMIDDEVILKAAIALHIAEKGSTERAREAKMQAARFRDKMLEAHREGKRRRLGFS